MTKQMMVFGLAALVLGGTMAAAAQQYNSNPLPPVGPKKTDQDQPAQPPAPTAQITADNPFPPVNPRMFTAALPARATVESFLKALWGYDPSRIWSVAGIEKTPAEGVSRITVLLSSRTGGGLQRATFFVLPDQKHAIAESVIPFGPQPFAEMRKVMQDRADGPALGAAGKELLLVEFADLQCARCKDAQATMNQLAQDFPQARIVFEDVPVDGHPAAYQAASYGVCVAQQSSAAFFTYVQAVYDSQDALTATGTEQALKDAVTKAGLNPGAVAACAATQATKDVLTGVVKLGQDAGVEQTPVLFANGRLIALGALPYDTIKDIVLHEAQMDGVSVPTPAPRLNTLK